MAQRLVETTQMFNLPSRLIAAGCVLALPAHAQPQYLVSSGTGAIQRYALDGTYLGDLIGPNNGLLGSPQHMALRANEVFTCGWFNHTVSVLDLNTGQVTRQFSAPNAVNPAFLRLSPDESELWVSYLGSSRIVRFNPDTGAVLGDLINPGLIARPDGIDVLANGDFMITSSDDTIYRVTAPDTATPIATLSIPDGRPLNTEILADGDTVLVTSFTSDTSLSLQSFSLSTGQIHGAFSTSRGSQADGLIRGHDGNLYVVYYGSGSVARYADDGTYNGDLVPPGAGLTQANHILLVPAPAAAALSPAAAFWPGIRRRR
ncbi:MAG: hypothetical protein H6811_00550 [Phycisphaeraceae bacterium]|nr:hypothetical protein [Phycisphaeraceae bacterium]